MKTRNVLIICVTLALIAWMKYGLPVIARAAERAAEREMQWEILRSLRLQPSLQVVPKPEPEANKL